MERRGAHTRWHIRPDEQVTIDWHTIRQCLTSTGTWRSGHDMSTLSSEFRHAVPTVLTFREVDSADTPLCQLADLMAGMAAYTRTNANIVRRQLAEPRDQGTLLGMSDKETPSSAEESRFASSRTYTGSAKGADSGSLYVSPATCVLLIRRSQSTSDITNRSISSTRHRYEKVFRCEGGVLVVPRTRRKGNDKGDLGSKVASIKYAVTRKNIPPAGLEAQGEVRDTAAIR